jgi:hypothetical protein
MPVYVDNARNPFGRMLMCHMVADSLEELLDMVDRIGLARRHFQNGSFPHFDLSQGYRVRAISSGAVAVDRRQLVAVMRGYRERLLSDPEEMGKLREIVSSLSAPAPRPRPGM